MSEENAGYVPGSLDAAIREAVAEAVREALAGLDFVGAGRDLAKRRLDAAEFVLRKMRDPSCKEGTPSLWKRACDFQGISPGESMPSDVLALEASPWVVTLDGRSFWTSSDDRRRGVYATVYPTRSQALTAACVLGKRFPGRLGIAPEPSAKEAV